MTSESNENQEPKVEEPKVEEPKVDAADLALRLAAIEKVVNGGMYKPDQSRLVLEELRRMNERIVEVQSSAGYAIGTVVFVILVVLIAAVVFIKRSPTFKRLNTYSRPRSCYACWRPWRGGGRNGPPVKRSFSSPELGSGHEEPLVTSAPEPSFVERCKAVIPWF